MLVAELGRRGERLTRAAHWARRHAPGVLAGIVVATAAGLIADRYWPGRLHVVPPSRLQRLRETIAGPPPPGPKTAGQLFGPVASALAVALIRIIAQYATRRAERASSA